MTIIVDENIQLEVTSEKYALQLFNVINNNREHLSEFLPWVETIKTLETFKLYLQNCEILCAEKKEVSFIILLNHNAIGRIGLHHLNPQNKIGSIGYWLDKSAEGKGIITKSCIKLIDYGFQEIDLNRIEIKASVKNIKSQKIPLKLNFKKEGILRQAEFVNNEFTDLFIYSILKEEWQI
ncbi:GNAT family N-acetyltransferase [Psychrobacter immobilis]|uniref:GNAT family N-acetyltransferase n=1 Tax=Psychrobacter immobilis TaxID=498 RepID=UPI00191B1FEC|nr:GNAT family protein [Psychrobacter immobilis]